MGDAAETKNKELNVPRTWIRPYYSAFNGIRGVAVGMVFLHHFGGSLQGFTGPYLWVGVDLFFVLSGFLITGILFDSLEDPRYFRNFYVRRALRIFPIFYGFFLVLGVLTLLLHLHMQWGILAFVFYFGNLTVPFAGLPAHNPTVISMLYHGHLVEVANVGHLWSLCVEEQFYLIWPAVVWWVRDRRRLMGVCVLVSVLTLAGRFCLHAMAAPKEIAQGLLNWSTYTRCDTLLVGAWLALFLRGRALSLGQLRRYSSGLFWIPLLGLLAGIIRWRGHGVLSNPFVLTVGYTLLALMGAGVLMRALDDDSLLSRALRWQPLSGLGAISYGFYFFHALPRYPMQRLVELHPNLINVAPLTLFGLTVLISWVSFRYYETPFLRLKKVLAPQRPDVKQRGLRRSSP